MQKTFVEEPFYVAEFFWQRKMLGKREGADVTIFGQECFFSQYGIISLGNPSVFQKFKLGKNLCLKGEYQDFL